MLASELKRVGCAGMFFLHIYIYIDLHEPVVFLFMTSQG